MLSINTDNIILLSSIKLDNNTTAWYSVPLGTWFASIDNGTVREELMLYSKTVAADLLFLVQIVCTLAFGGSQFMQLLVSTEGVGASWFISWEIFLLLNLWLAAHAHLAQPSRVTRQALASYVLWIIMVTADLGAMVWNKSYVWGSSDTWTLVCVLVGVGGTILVASHRQLGVHDPMVRGWFAVFFKAVPQFVLAWTVSVHGSDGLATTALVAGHLTILTRIGQLTYAIREAGWDRNRLGSALSEVGNEVSWLVVTLAWLLG